MTQPDVLAQLLELNLEVARRIDAGEKVVSPGIPPGYRTPGKFITDDCIQPASRPCSPTRTEHTEEPLLPRGEADEGALGNNSAVLFIYTVYNDELVRSKTGGGEWAGAAVGEGSRGQQRKIIRGCARVRNRATLDLRERRDRSRGG